jgi:hypothetical protein
LTPPARRESIRAINRGGDVTDRLRNVSRRTGVTAVAGVVVLVFAAVALAGSGFKNGGFEAGFESWKVASSGAGDWFVEHQGPLPLSNKKWRGPTEHELAAVSDQANDASGVLYRFIKVGSKNIRLTLSLYYTNYAAGFCTPSTLDETIGDCNQQFRVEILRSTASPWSVSGKDVLKGVFKTKGGFANAADPKDYVANLTGLGDKVMLRIAWAANDGVLNATVDNVRVNSG